MSQLWCQLKTESGFCGAFTGHQSRTMLQREAKAEKDSEAKRKARTRYQPSMARSARIALERLNRA